MTKDCRIVVRMSEELRDWVHAQAQLGEQDDAAFVRMVLSNLRRGASAAPPQPIVPAAPVVREVLDVASYGTGPAMAALPQLEEDNAQAAERLAEGDASIDVDALVAASLAVAEEQGLTQPQIEAAQGEMPDSGVRALFRRPVPYSRGTAPQHLQSMLG